jgi:GNAT superfamily N-acetyltransferase
VAGLSAQLAEVLRRAGNPVGAALAEPDLLRDGFGSDPAFGLLVAELDGAIAGYLLHHPSYDPDRGGRVTTVVDLFVSPGARRQGVGRALMAAASERCRRAGGRALVWWVRPANRDAVAFYERLGGVADPGSVAMSLRAMAR